MGIIIGKFRKKKSTYEILEKLENEILSIEEFGRSTEQFRKKVITRFILLAVFIYILLACLLYLYYNKISSNQKFVYVVPFVAFPFIIFFIKKFLAWYYHKKIQRNEKKLVSLKEEKKKIIDNVMETETYKVAKKILDKFGNETKKTVPEMSLATNLLVRNSQTGLKQRNWTTNQGPKGRLSFGTPKTPGVGIPESPYLLPDKTLFQPTPSVGLQSALATPKYALPMPRPATPAIAAGIAPLPLMRTILPNNRSVLDKMVDYLVGDGPSNRFALICKSCSCHNGMAMKEEFEYLSFKCCYCSHFNPARKKKPTGPKFEASKSIKITSASDNNSNSDSDKDNPDSESEQLIENSDARRSSSESDMPIQIGFKTKISSEEQLPQQLNVDTRNSSPELEKYSDFDKLSDCESREGDGTDKVPEDSNLSLELVSKTIENDEESESPMEIDLKNLETKSRKKD